MWVKMESKWRASNPTNGRENDHRLLLLCHTVFCSDKRNNGTLSFCSTSRFLVSLQYVFLHRGTLLYFLLHDLYCPLRIWHHEQQWFVEWHIICVLRLQHFVVIVTIKHPHWQKRLRSKQPRWLVIPSTTATGSYFSEASHHQHHVQSMNRLFLLPFGAVQGS